MPTTRKPVARQRRPAFTPEILRLFVELESGLKRGERFKAKERELMRMLGLTEQYWTMNSVLDTSPCYTVCRQSISDSWLGNLRECLAHLV